MRDDLRGYVAPRAPWMTIAMLALFACALAIPEAEGQIGYTRETATPAHLVYSAPTCPRTHPWGWERLRLMVATKHRDADKWAVQCFYGTYHSAATRFAP